MESIQSTSVRSHVNLAAQIKPRRAGVPCVRCRQMKIKCNASQRFPASCSGCAKAGERCTIDPSFKRTPKRGLKPRPVYGRKDSAYRTLQSEASGTEPTGLSLGTSGSLHDDYALESSVGALTAELRLGGRRLNRFVHEATSVNLTPSAVAELLEEYYLRIHPKFPLLLNPTAVIDSYEKLPLLFWTVLAIACKDSENYASDYARLQILLRQLVADILLLGTRSIYHVQALLLLCVWSFPHEDMNKEPFSMYCAVAISMARSLGLHRPRYPFNLFAAKASEIGSMETRTSTWLSCFIVDQWHTARFGVPASIRPDHTILHTLNASTPGIPTTTIIQLHLALVTSRISAGLGECETSATGLAADPLPLMRVFQTELSMIQEKYASEWSPADEVTFLDARLSLYSYILDHRKPERLKNRHPENEIITRSSITASQLLIVLNSFPETLRKGTFHVLRSASYAAFFLLRILGTAPNELFDETNIRNIIRQTFTLLRDISQTANVRRSQCMRVCRIIENMIDYEDWNKDTPFLGKAEAFMANNFVADVAARGMIKANMRHAAAQNERDCREAMATGAPPPPDIEPNFDLDFSIWDPMEWNVNWQGSDDLLFLSENLGESS